jgi:2-hydroxy-6-oxonona-2,4-dienedioate hydrolase
MPKTPMFESDAARARIRAFYDRFRARLAGPVEEVTLHTSFGLTHALLAGPCDAPPLVVCHGALASSAHVLPELGGLVDHHRVAALDVLGQSVMSEERRLDVRTDEHGRWVLESASALGLERFDLLGVSWGGFVARQAALVAPERVRKLVLVVPAGWVSGSAWRGFVEMGLPLMLYRAFPSQARFTRLLDGLTTESDAEWSAYLADAFRDYRLDLRIPPTLTAAEAATLRCPLLVLAAEGDVSFPGEKLLARVRELVPHAEVELMRGVKHSPPATPAFRAWLGQRVGDFLRGESGAGPSTRAS